MQVTITIDGNLTNEDRAILHAIAGCQPDEPKKPEPKKPEPKKPEPKKPEPKKPEPKKPEPKEPEPKEPEPKEPEPKKPEPKKPEPKKPEPKEEGPSLVEQAVNRAASMLSSGEIDKVKSILADLGAARVSQLTDSQARGFLEAAS